jgi:hypothetical protein
LQTIDNSKKSGVLHLTRTARGAIYFRNGNPVDAELNRAGARAIYRAPVWTETVRDRFPRSTPRT